MLSVSSNSMLARAACVLGTLAGMASFSHHANAQTTTPPPAPTLDHIDPRAVTNVPAVRRVLSMARDRRIDFAFIGDSNTRQLGITGHEDMLARTWARYFGMYASRLDPGATYRNNWGSTSQSQVAGSSFPFGSSNVPREVQSIIFASDESFPVDVATLGPGQTAEFTFNNGFTLLPDHPMDLTQRLRFHMVDFTFGPAYSGYFAISARQPYPGSIWDNFAGSAPISTATAVRGVRTTAIDVPSGQRGPFGLLFGPTNPSAIIGAVGPVCLMYQRVEAADRTTGISFHTLWQHGGYSAWHAASSLASRQSPKAAVQFWFQQVTRLQNAAPAVVVNIMHGGNDPGYYFPSFGPGGFSSREPEGHEENLRFIIGTLRAWWVELGYDPANLFFQLGPYHPRPDERGLRFGYEAAWKRIASADPQVFAVAGNQMSTPDEFTARGFYRSDADRAHLSQPGYDAWARAAVRTLRLAACPADVDDDGVATTADIFAFLSHWFATDLQADADFDGVVSTPDIFTFLSTWFQGC